MSDPTTLADRLRVGAEGTISELAGVELMIAFGRGLSTSAPWIMDWPEHGIARIDGAALLDASGPWSGGERRVTAIIASLVSGEPVDLSDALTGLDQALSAAVARSLLFTLRVDPARLIPREDDNHG